MSFVSILTFFFSLAVLGVLIAITLRPSPLKPLIRLAIAAPSYALDRQYVVSQDSDHVLYGEPKNASVAVLLIGGAFLFNDFKSHYGLSNALGGRLVTHGVDLLMLRYPVRFNHTVHDAMLALNTLLQRHVLRYKSCHMIGFSAGALLAGVFARKERSRAFSDLIAVPQIGLPTVKSYVGICGLYDVRFDNSMLTQLFEFYILTGTPEYKRYNCRELGVPVYLVSSEHDALVSQTRRYIETEPCNYKIFAERLPHTFMQCINLSQTQDALTLIVKFIVKNM